MTDEVIVCSTFGVGHCFHQLSVEASLKTFNLICLCINEFWGIAGQVIEGMHIHYKSLGPLGELVHTDVIRLLPEIAGVFSGIKHLHDSEHSTHSRTQAQCLLVMVPHHRNTVMLPPNYHSGIHLRNSSHCTVGE